MRLGLSLSKSVLDIRWDVLVVGVIACEFRVVWELTQGAEWIHDGPPVE